MWFAPSVDGSVTIRARTGAFVASFTRRVAAGLLAGAPATRNHYLVTEEQSDRLRVRAAGWWTAVNVGLNDVRLAVTPDGHVQYAIRYWRWAGYALAVSGTLGAIFIGFLLAFDIRAYVARHPASRVPGLSVDQNAAIAWAMALFWGIAFPWILVALHKRPLRRLMDRIIAEVDVAAMSEDRG